MRIETYFDDWIPSDEGWSYAASVPADAARVTLLALFDVAEDTCEPRLEGFAPRERRDYAMELAHVTALAFPDAAPERLAVAFRAAPTRMVMEFGAARAAGRSAVGCLPRSLSARPAVARAASLSMERAIERLEGGDLDLALRFAARLCLSGETEMLKAFWERFTIITVTRPMLRDARLGLLVAAFAGL